QSLGPVKRCNFFGRLFGDCGKGNFGGLGDPCANVGCQDGLRCDQSINQCVNN
ncbi:2139_t:CDS:1, partial [Gigaspora rosea]